MSGLIVALVFVAGVGLYLLRYYCVIGYPRRYTLAPYQGGMVYRRGKPIRDAGPGRHLVFVGTEKIIFLDKRPIQANFEDRAVTVADGAIAVYGFAMSAQVSNVRKAMYASANYNQMPAFIGLCVTRRILNDCETSRIGSGWAAIESEMTELCRSRLAAAGFDLNSFRLTQLRIAVPGQK